MNPIAHGMNLAWRTINSIRDRMNVSGDGMNLTWRTVNSIRRRMSLALRTINSIRDRIHPVGRGMRAAGVKSTNSAAITAMAAPVENAAACETRS